MKTTTNRRSLRTKILHYDHVLTIGGSDCGMKLTYTADEIPLY
jgi:hypothetical protein